MLESIECIGQAMKPDLIAVITLLLSLGMGSIVGAETVQLESSPSPSQNVPVQTDATSLETEEISVTSESTNNPEHLDAWANHINRNSFGEQAEHQSVSEFLSLPEGMVIRGTGGGVGIGAEF